jgi:glycogen debranching enzyme
MADDMFSGWGVRTLSAHHPAFDPNAYHRGTVWPVGIAATLLSSGDVLHWLYFFL